MFYITVGFYIVLLCMFFVWFLCCLCLLLRRINKWISCLIYQCISVCIAFVKLIIVNSYQNDTQRLPLMYILFQSLSTAYCWSCMYVCVLFNNNNNTNDNVSSTVIGARNCESSFGSRDEYSTMPAGSRPLDQANQLEPQARLYRQPVNLIHHPHLLLLLSPKLIHILV